MRAASPSVSHRSHSWLARSLAPALASRRRLRSARYARKRRVLDDFAAIAQSDVVVRVNEFDGEFFLDPSGDILARLVLNGSYEPQLVAIAAQYVDPARDAIDIGANVGFYSVMLAHLLQPGQRVLAIEPTSAASNRLRRNLHLNGVAHQVEVFLGAATNRQGSVDIRAIVGKEEYSTIGSISHPSAVGQPFATETVQATTVDSLVKELSLDPGFVKLDVEGAEHLVLQGASELLQVHRPVILSEASDFLLRQNGSSASQLISILEHHGYTVTDPHDPTRRPGAGAFDDILCIPHG